MRISGLSPRVGAEVVPLVRPRPVCWQKRGRRLKRIFDQHRSGLDLGMAGKVGADKPTVERPVVLGVAGRVHADVSATCADVAFERLLVRALEHVAGRHQEHDGPIASQAGVRKHARIFGACRRRTRARRPAAPRCRSRREWNRGGIPSCARTPERARRSGRPPAPAPGSAWRLAEARPRAPAALPATSPADSKARSEPTWVR